MNGAKFPFLSILTLIFITLKLTDEIGWSWWWVLSPIWIPLVIMLLLFALGGALTMTDTRRQRMAAARRRQERLSRRARPR